MSPENPLNIEPLFSRHGVSMDRVCPELREIARKNLSAILRASAEVGQVHIGNALEIHEASVSRMKLPGSDFERMALILAACGITLNSPTQITVEQAVFKSALVLAKENLAQSLGG